MFTVVVVDDHTLLSQAISELVNSFDDFKTIYQCKNGEDLLAKLKFQNNIPDLVLMDVNMPILNGIETTQILKTEHPNVKVIALSVEDDEDTIVAMLRSGAKGYLLKDTKREVLEEALKSVINKGYYHTNTVAELLIGNLNKEDEEETLEFTEREIKFLEYACSEMTYKEIAEKMCVSPKTVDGYRDTMFKKLNIKNRIGLVLYAIRNNLFTP